MPPLPVMEYVELIVYRKETKLSLEREEPKADDPITNFLPEMFKFIQYVILNIL